MDILLATAHTDLRLSLELLLDQEPGVKIVGTASETAGLRALVLTTQPDIVLADWDLPGNGVVGLLADMHDATQPHPSFIILSSQASAEQEVLAAGAVAFVFKGDSPENLLEAFRRVRRAASSA